MSARSPAGLWIFFAFAAVVLPAAFVLCNIPGSLTLERAFPTSHGVELNHLRARDRARHGRMLQAASGVVDFPVEGTYDPYLVGLYFTRVQLGSPPKEFYVQIDTGSDVLWVGCKPCSGCPTSSGLQIPLEFFDPKSSPTASPVSCSDSICEVGAQSSDTVCSSKNDQCSYTFQYGDGSGTSGYYVADLLYLNTVVGNTITSNSTVPVVFGCSTSQTGDLMKSDRAVDGIFGFGQQGLSVISQLSSQGIVPNSFSHCLKGSNGGGGILVFGSIINPNLVYSPLVPSMPHYNLNLQSISVNGRRLAIDPYVFATSVNKGTIIDCGTTLAYLAEEAYDPFVNAITATISQNVRPVLSNGSQCFLIDASVSDIFPPVSLDFAGDAHMILKPEDYMLQQQSIGGASVWCIGFQKSKGQGITILGDLVLKDKIVVYDLGGQRIGWTNYDCSSAVNVSNAKSPGKKQSVNAGLFGSSSSRSTLDYSLLVSVAAASLLFHISSFGSFPFL